MSNELESDSAMVMNLESSVFESMVLVTMRPVDSETEPPSSTNPQLSEDDVSGH